MAFSDLYRDAKQRDEYWIEDATVAFTARLYSLMKKRGISQAELAERIGASQPYIARILKGRDNLTIATMVKLARAVGARLDLSLREDEAELAAEPSEVALAVPLTASREVSRNRGTKPLGASRTRRNAM